MTRSSSPLLALHRVRSFICLLLLTACGGRTDLEDWTDFSDPSSPDGGSGGAPVSSVGGTSPTAGSGGVFGIGGSGGAGGTVGAGGDIGTGGTDDTGGAGGEVGTGGAGGTGGTATSVEGDVFVDCETTIANGDGFSWNTPLKHPALAFPGRQNGDVIYFKAGTCHAWHDAAEPLLTIPDGLSITLAGGYDGNNLNDQFAHSGGKTVFSGDNNEDDIDLPGTLSTSPEFLESRSDNSSTIVSVGTNADVLITNLEISGAFDYTGTSVEFGCISVGQDALLTAVGTTIRNCAAVYSAGLRAALGSSVELSNVLVEDNQTFGENGVVTASGASLLVDEQSEFRRNRALYGGAIALQQSSLEVSGALFEDNHAPALGGAIYVGDASSTAILEDVTFESNSASSGGAIANTGGSLTATTCQFLENSAGGNGGSVFVNEGDLTVLESTFEGGTAPVGGELGLWSTDETVLDSNSFWNGAADVGGTIYVANSALLSVFTSRFINGSAENGGQIMASNTPVALEHSLFLGGDASQGGALFTSGGELTVRASAFMRATGVENGSVIAAWGSTLLLDTNTFVDNGSPGSPVIGVSGSPNGVVSRCVFRDNVGEGVLRPTATSIYLADSYIGTHSSESLGALVVGAGGTLTTRGLTLAENTTSSVSTPVVTVQLGGTLSLQNAVIWGSASAPEPWISFETDMSTVSVTSSCGPAELATYGTSTTLTSSPFANLPPQIPLFQATGSPCIDQGTHAGQDYSTVSVVTPFSADDGSVDPGYHFSAATPIAGELLLSPTQATWDIEIDWWCTLLVPSERVELGTAPSGSYEHSFPTGTDFWLICTAPSDTPPVVLKATL